MEENKVMDKKGLKKININNLHVAKVGKMKINKQYPDIFTTITQCDFKEIDEYAFVKLYKDKDGCTYGKDIFTKQLYYSFDSNELKRNKVKDGEYCIDDIIPIIRFIINDEVREKAIRNGYVNILTINLIYKYIKNKITDQNYYRYLKEYDIYQEEDNQKLLIKKR